MKAHTLVSVLALGALAGSAHSAPAPKLHLPAGTTPPAAGVQFRAQPVRKDNLYIRISQYAGQVAVDGWANEDQAAKYWSNITLADRPLNLQFNVANQWVQTCYNNRQCADHSTEWLGVTTLNDNGRSVDSEYAKRFGGLISTLESDLTPGQQNAVALKNVIRTGDNAIHFVVRPSSSQWSVTVQIYTQSDDGHEAVIQETHLDQRTGELRRRSRCGSRRRSLGPSGPHPDYGDGGLNSGPGAGIVRCLPSLDFTDDASLRV